jgi:cytochrome c556
MLVSVVAATADAAEQPQSVVKYRQSVMKAMAAYMTLMSLELKGEVSYPAQTALHAEGLNRIAKELPDIFPASSSPGQTRTEAKAELWRDWPKFISAARALDDQSAKLAAAAKAGNRKGIAEGFTAVGKACSACHDQFRVQDQE